MNIESETDGKKGIGIIITLEPDDNMFIKETMIPIKLTIKKLGKKSDNMTIEKGYIIQVLKDTREMTEGWERDQKLMDDNTLLERRFKNIYIKLSNLINKLLADNE